MLKGDFTLFNKALNECHGNLEMRYRIIMATPYDFCPRDILKSGKYLLNEFVEEKTLYGLLMKCIKCAECINEQKDLLEDGFVRLCKLSCASPAYYYLSYVCKTYDHSDLPIPSKDRMKALFYYYKGHNCLMTREFPLAEECFMKAFHYSCDVRDVRKSVLNWTTLASYLAGTPEYVFRSREINNEFLSKEAEDLWRQELFPIELFADYSELIRQEKTKRLFIYFSKAVTSFHVSHFPYDMKLIFDSKIPGVEYTVDNDVVTFIKTSYDQEIEAQIRKMNK